MVHISVLKIAKVGAFEGKIHMSAILEIRGLFFYIKFPKIRRRGSHLSHTDIIFGQI